MRLLLLGSLAFFSLFGCVTHAIAAPSVDVKGATVIVNGVPVLEIRAASGGVRPSIRAQVIAGAIATVSENEPVSTRKVEKEYEVRVGEVTCLTVTRLDARAYHVLPAELARTWASKIGSALALPPIKPSQTNLTLPVGGVRTITVIGSQAATASIKVSGTGVTAARTAEGIQIKGTAVGYGTVSLEAGNMVEPISVAVRPYAAKFPQSLSAEVSGIPAMGSTVAGAIETAMRDQLRGLPFVAMKYEIPQGRQLPSGEARTYTVRVRAQAPDAFEAVGNVNVVVRNLPVNRKPDAELYYSNNPEIVTRAQSLFSARLKPDVPARFLYHHINGTTYPMFLRVQAVNESDVPVKVLVLPGDSRPERNPVLAGLMAADQYFRAWTMSSGEVVTIPPRSTLPISLRRLAPNETSSGLCGLRIISGNQPLLIRSDSWPPFNLEPKWASAIASSTPWREVGCPPMNEFDRAPYNLSEHVYPNPQKSEQVKYQVGGRYGFVRIGQRAIMRQDENSRLDGNFGVLYNIKGQVQNPTNTPTDIEVVFEASAGYSGGLFLVDGNVLRTSLLQPKTESQLARFRIAPGEVKNLNIWTIPLSGSSYPATITIRPVLNLGIPIARRVNQ